MFYVYAYIRSKDSITAKAGTPYYIGKGKNKRAYSKNHTSALPGKSKIIFLETNLTEIGALALERRMIAWWGRKDIGTGILNNKTDGGDGISGAALGPRSDSTKEKIRKGNTGKLVTDETKARLSKSNLGKKRGPMSEEHKQKIRESNTGNLKITNSLKGKTFDDIYGDSATMQKEKRSTAHRGKLHGPMSEEHKQKIRESNTGKKRQISECPNCGKSGALPLLKRWHFENCKVVK